MSHTRTSRLAPRKKRNAKATDRAQAHDFDDGSKSRMAGRGATKLVDERTEELRVQAEEFERQATHDKLTGLPNRRHADSYLQQQVDLAQRRNRRGALALADVDHFKRINDDFSHATGDQVLERVAQILSEGCRRSDFVARYGGEEFLLYFPDTGVDRAIQVCSELRKAVQQYGGARSPLGLDRIAELTAANPGALEPRELVACCPMQGILLVVARELARAGEHSRAERAARMAAEALGPTPTVCGVLAEVLELLGESRKAQLLREQTVSQLLTRAGG